jgi:polyribonucleotide nucleotidyltransferase
MMPERVELELEGKRLTIETGAVGRQADGSTLVRLEDTVLLATAVASKKPLEGRDFLPLTVDYREKAYAAGKIPGGFFKREGRPSEKEVLSSRLIDRPLRPLFPEGYFNEVQVMALVLSSDQENDADVLGIIGASTALCLSSIPFTTPVGAVRIGRQGGELVVNPGFSQLESSDMNLVIAGTKSHINMVEGGARELPEQVVMEALSLGHRKIQEVVELQERLVAIAGKRKAAFEPLQAPQELADRVSQLCAQRVQEANRIVDKVERQSLLETLVDETVEALQESFPDRELMIKGLIGDLEKKDARRMIIEENRRLDARDFSEVRPISSEVGLLPRAHGSALFTRGQTQALVAVTLGTKMDEQKIDDLEGESFKSYMLHYNFPPFSVGETRPIRGPGRREIGHGALAERAIEPVIPREDIFPYTIRLVSDILESNGSSSMATVCAGSLSLMDAGIPIKSAVAGIAMGLIKENDKVAILTDILGAEDHYGDMDFKVAGTREGITAFQMDVKISGLDLGTIGEALERAREARLSVLEAMNQAISKPRSELSPYAPRIIFLKIKPEKIGDVIGTGGKIIRSILEKTGAKIDIEDDGTVLIASVDQRAGEMAREMVLQLVEEPEVGKIYKGKVKRITPFGAFVEILPNQDGLLHISEIDFQRVNRVEDFMRLGDEVTVKVVDIDPEGKIRLSRKACLPKPEVRARRKE